MRSNALPSSFVLVLLALSACDAEPEQVTSFANLTHPTTTASPDGFVGTDTGPGPDTSDSVSPDTSSADSGTASPDTTPADTGPDTDTTVTPDTDTTDTIEPDIGPDPTPPTTPAVTDQARTALSAAIESARSVAALNGHTFSGAVIDLETGDLVYGSRQSVPMIPASNTKIVTTAAAIGLLGEDYRILTRAFSPTAPDGSGRVASLHLHSGHDFSWSRWFYANPREPLDVLADRLYRRGLRRVDGTLEIWGAYCYEGQNLGTYDPATHRATAAARFRDALTARGITVVGGSNLNASMAVPTGVELARFESQPLHVLLWAINRISHNEMADILMRHIGYAKGTESSYAAGSKVVLEWLAGRGMDTAGMVLNDGSGLATTNRFTALQLAQLYRVMANHPAGAAWRTSLSIGGGQGPGSSNDAGTVVVTTNDAPYMGTLAYRMTSADVAGRVFGKSGTNAGITTTGVLSHRYDRREYAFAFMMNGITSGAYPAARTAQDNMVVALGKRLRGPADPPSAPTMSSAELTNNYRVRLTWTAVPNVPAIAGQGGYLVHLSSDGRTFPPEKRRHTTLTSLELPALSPGEMLVAQVSAITASGESLRSSALAVRRGPEGATHVLLVDGFDRWQRQPTNENPMAAPHAFVVREAEAFEGVHLDSVANENVTATSLERYELVVVEAGEESASDETFSPAEQVLYADYLEGGGAMLVSGAEVAWDLDPRGNTSATANDKTFLGTWLKTGYGSDDAQTFVAGLDAAGPIYQADTGLDRIDFYTPGQMFVAYPDVLTAVDGARPILRYANGTDIAALAWEGPFKVAHLGFPLASVSDRARRTRLAGLLADWLLP